MSELGICWEREALTGGRYRHVQHLRPIAYQDGSTLRRIDPRWADSGISARPHIVTASRLMTSVGDDGMRRIHPTRDPERYLEIGAPYVKVSGTWRKVSFSNTVRTKNMLAWTRPEANLAILHAGHYVKLAMELKNGYTPEDNLSALAGMTIDSAELALVAIEGSNATMTAHRALTQWYEGDGNIGAPSGDGSTWNYRNHSGSVAWAGGAGGAAGSDWVATATDSQTSVSNVFTLDVAADVQDFADGTATNYGWWLRVPAWEITDWNVCRFYSSDGTAANRPTLTVVYTAGGGTSIVPHAMHYARMRRAQ